MVGQMAEVAEKDATVRAEWVSSVLGRLVRSCPVRPASGQGRWQIWSKLFLKYFNI